MLHDAAPVYDGGSTRAVSLTEGVPAGIATFRSKEARYEFAMRQAAKGANYFVGYIDVNGPYGLSYGHAKWVRPGCLHIKDLHGLIH